MSPLILIVVAVAVLALGVWSHGGYEACAASGPGTTLEGPTAWFYPLGIAGLLVAVGLGVIFTIG